MIEESEMKLIQKNKKYNTLFKYGALDLENGAAVNLNDFNEFSLNKHSVIDFQADFIN